MAGGLLAGLLWKVAGTFFSHLEGKVVVAFSEDSLLYKAVRSTTEAFPELEGVSGTLKRWCESDAFRLSIERLREGQRDLTDDEIVRGFVEATGFYSGNETNPDARRLIECLLSTIAELVYASSGGLALHARREEVLHAGTVSKIGELQESISLVTAQLAQLTPSKNLFPSDDLGKNPQVEEKILHGKIDQARDLIKDGKPSSARLILKRLRDQLVAESPSAELSFRITTNLGVCALHLGENEIAISEFRDAIVFQPTSAKALSNGSIAALVDGNLDEALALSKRARAAEPKESMATTVLIQALHGLSHKQELNSLLATEAWIEQDSACSFAIGELRLKDGDFQGAEKVLRNSVARGDRNPSLLILLAKVIIDPVLNCFRENAPLRWRMPPEAVKRIEEGEGLLHEAVESLSRQEDRSRLHDAIAFRGGIRSLLGEMDEGLDDCNRVLAENKNHVTALHNKALILFSQEKFKEAIPVGEAAASNWQDSGFTIMLANAYSATNNHAKAISLLEPLWQPETHGREQTEIAGILVRQYSLAGNDVRAADVIRVLTESWPDDPDALVIRARELRINKKYQEALSLTESIPVGAAESIRDRVALERAEIHFASENYAEAAKVLGEIVEKTHDNPLTRMYIASLFNSQQFQEALHAARAVRMVEGAKPQISEMEALILESIGDLRGASELWRELERNNPENVRFRLSLANLDFRSGNRDNARKRLSAIQFDEIKDDAEALIQVAQERTLLGMSGVLPLVYRARQIDFGNPDVHLAYFSMFFSREDLRESALSPEVVGPDCVVHLRCGHETLIFTILQDSSLDRSRNELSMSDTLATKLLGRRKGEHVVLKDTPLEQLLYEVTEIQSKYVYAFRQSLNEFTTRFSDHPGFYRMEFKENDFSPLLTVLDKRHAFITQLTLLYQEKGLPLSSMSQLSEIRLVEVWAGMMSWENGRIRAAMGSMEERNTASAALANSEEVVADLVALLTMSHVKLLDRLPKRFSKIVVPQAVLDELNLTLAGKVLGGRPSGTLGKSGDRYFHREITSDELARGKQFLEDIRDFVESSTEVTPVPSLLSVTPERGEELRQILPECALASILAASERSTILFSDDLGLRQVAETEWKVKGVWVQTILWDLLKRNIITTDEYHQAVQRLVVANYYFVSITPNDILHELNKNHWDIAQEITRLFATLHAPDCEESTAVVLVADLIRAVWLEPIMDHQRQMVLDLALNALTTNRLSGRVLLKLNLELKRRFVLLPLHYQTVMQTVQLWQRQNLARQGLVR